MEAKFKRVVFKDEWIRVDPWVTRMECFEFENYALGWQFQASARELRLIERNQMWGHHVVQIRNDDYTFTWADVLGPEFIPEVNPDPEHLLRVEAMLRAAAAKWSHFLEGME
jgi:hypothetical protein